MSSDNNVGGERPPGGASTDGTLRDDLGKVRDEVRESGAAAFESLKEGAASLGSEAKDRLSQYAAGQKEFVSENLGQFAQAVRRASDELSERDQTMASQLVRQAAGGLESLSRSISGSSFEDILGSVRGFGRSNPAAFMGGAVLVGFALGRFATASASRADDQANDRETDQRDSAADRESGGPGRSFAGAADSPGDRLAAQVRPGNPAGSMGGQRSQSAGGGGGTVTAADSAAQSRPASVVGGGAS